MYRLQNFDFSIYERARGVSDVFSDVHSDYGCFKKNLDSRNSAFQQHLLLKADVSELKLSSDSTYLPQTATEYSIVLYARSEMLKSMFWVLHKPLNPQKLGILRRFLSGVR